MSIYIYSVKQVENCSKFWFQPESVKRMVEFYVRELNENGQEISKPCTDYSDLNRTMIIAVRDQIDNKLRRARLNEFNCDSISMKFKGIASFIDTGRTQKCELKDIYLFTRPVEQSQMPPRCFPCRLAEVQPSTSNISGGFMWDREAIELLNKFALHIKVKAEVRNSTIKL